MQADADQIGQVVLNLLVNAQQALAGSTARAASGSRPGCEPAARRAASARVWLRVPTTARASRRALRARLFEPFFTTKAEGVGTGLGLAVSRSLAREHGGDARPRAAAGRGGASFRLSLPLGRRRGAERGAERRAPSRPSAAGARCSWSTTRPRSPTLMRDMLESAGYDVATAESGAVALELLDTARFDAIVSDLRMPDMDGAGALARGVGAPSRARRGACCSSPATRCRPTRAQFLEDLEGPVARQAVLEGRPAGRVAALLE